MNLINIDLFSEKVFYGPYIDLLDGRIIKEGRERGVDNITYTNIQLTQICM